MMTTYSQTNHLAPSTQSGQLLILVLVFSSVFLIIITSFVGSVVSQARVVDVRFEQQRATEIAESGLNYYKWFVSHYPANTSLDGITTEYRDPVTNEPIGEYTLDIDSTSYCGNITALDVTSTAATYANPDAQAIVSATYKRPTVAEYSFITNSGVWFGDSVVQGPLHSNQGLRMESAHNSSIGSGQATWDCDASYGCNPTVVDAPGVYSNGTTSNPSLFEYPVSPIDFAGLNLDLSSMLTSAQSDGIHRGPTTNYGYEVIFNGDGTVTINEVTDTIDYESQSAAEGRHTGERNIINTTVPDATETIDPDCPILFFEDKVWLSGDIDQKVAIAAADLSSFDQTNIVLNGSIEYVPGTRAGLMAIAEDDVDIGVTVPEEMVLNGIFIAQNGRYGRNLYRGAWFPGTSYNKHIKVNSLTFLGTLVSNERAIVNWIAFNGNLISGFLDGTSSFDRNQVDDPPPLTPETNDEYQLQDWRTEG